MQKTFWLKLSAFFIAGFGLQLITRHAPSPELVNSFIYALPGFLIFILFVAGLFSWGAWVRQRLAVPFFSGSENGFFDLSVGCMIAYLSSYVFTILHLFSSSQNYILWAFLATGFALGGAQVKPKLWFKFGKDWLINTLIAVLLIIVFLRLIEGLQFPQHGDPYAVYLPAPRMWSETGGFDAFIKIPEFFVATTWESIWAWGNALLGLTGGAGLDLFQWFAQWTTSGIGLLGLILALTALTERLIVSFPLYTQAIPVIVLAAVQIPALRWTANLAKNDTGLAFWGVSAFYFATYLASLSPVLALLTGILIGATVIGKLPFVIFGILISLGVVVQSRKNFLPLVVGGLIGIGPILIRNIYYTHNPVIPWLPQIFGTLYLTRSALTGAQNATGIHFKFENTFAYTKEILEQMPLFISLLLMPFLKNYGKAFSRIIIIPLLALILFTLAFRPATEIRYQGPTLVIMVLYSTFFAFFLIQYFLKNHARWGALLLGVAILANSNISFFTLKQIGTSKFGVFAVKFPQLIDVGGTTKLWMRQNLNPADSILDVGDSHFYYIMDYPLTIAVDSLEWDQVFFDHTPPEILNHIKLAPFKNLFLNLDGDTTHYHNKLVEVMDLTQSWDQACNRLRTPKAQVWNLECLQKSNK